MQVGHESGRDESTVAEQLSGEVSPRNTLNDLTAKEWVGETVSVWTQRGLGSSHPDAHIEKQHPAPFSFTDVARLIRFFTKRGDVVLDPFVGVGSTLKACAVEGRRGIGIELNEHFAELAKQRLASEITPELWPVPEQRLIVGDARHLTSHLAPDTIDFIVTSPPYWNILHKEDHKVRQERVTKGLTTRYGDDPRDLGNIESYADFLDELVGVLAGCLPVLRKKRYMAVVVSDFRDGAQYRMFHADLAQGLEGAGLTLKGVKILYQRHKRVFPYGYPTSYVPNIHHQYILILQRGAA